MSNQRRTQAKPTRPLALLAANILTGLKNNFLLTFTISFYFLFHFSEKPHQTHDENQHRLLPSCSLLAEQIKGTEAEALVQKISLQIEILFLELIEIVEILYLELN